MKIHLRKIITVCAFLLAGVHAEAEKLTIAVANYPLYYFAERIAGDEVDIYYPIPTDEDPAFWVPKAEEVVHFQKADLIMMNGATYSKWRETVSLPEDKIVDTSLAFTDRLIKTEETLKHSHGNGEEHSHAGTAFTTWLDMQQSIKQAAEIKEALLSIEELDEKALNANFEQLKQDLLELDSKYKKATDNLEVKVFIASHPIYQYWSRAYNIKVDPLVWEPEMNLHGHDLKDLATLQTKNPEVKYFIWEGQPSDTNAEQIIKRGLKNIIIEPCFSKPNTGDFLSVMHQNIEQLESINPVTPHDKK